MANTIDSAIEFLEKIKAEESVTIKFKKADGTERIMLCTLNFDKIPKSDRPKEVNLPKILNQINKNNLVHVYDLEKKGWRAVKFDKVEWLKDEEDIKFSIKK